METKLFEAFKKLEDLIVKGVSGAIYSLDNSADGTAGNANQHDDNRAKQRPQARKLWKYTL